MAEKMTPDYWPANTRVQMCKVPWDDAYRDIVVFDNMDKQDAYFNKIAGESWINESFRYLKPFEPIRVPIPYSNSYQYNYLVVTNTANPVPGEGEVRALYYFIENTKYINPQVCEVEIMLDVVMTYQHYVKIGQMYVENSHALMSNIAVPDKVSELTGQVLYEYMTLDEGIDIGQQYSHVAREWFPLNVTGDYDDHLMLGRIIVTSTVNLAADPGDVNNPNLDTADGQSTDGLPSGCNVYTFPGDESSIKTFMKELSTRSWAAQGIVSISTYPGKFLTAGPEVTLFGSKTNFKMTFIGETPTMDKDYYDEADSEYKFNTGNIFNKLARGFQCNDIDNSDLKKLYTYPYSVIEMTSYDGNPIYLKPELVQGNTLSMYAIGCAIAPFARVGIIPTNYNLATNMQHNPEEPTWKWVAFGMTEQELLHTGVIPMGDFLDTCLWITDFPQFSIVNNNYITYMASTANTRAYQYESAGWTYKKGLATADTNYSNALRGADTELANYNASTGGLIGNVGNMLQGVGNNSAQNSYTIGNNSFTPSAAQNAMNNAVAGNWGTSFINNLTGYTQLQNNQNLARANAEANFGLANYANQGDYENTIRSIQAQYNDAALKPPSTLGQMGGNGFMWKNGLVGFAVSYKTISGAAMRSIGEFFRRYGYRINRWLNFSRSKDGTLKNLKVMSKFSYWKAKETYITCAYANESEKNVLRGILEKGVTIWGDPEDIGLTQLKDNLPLRNIHF
jgi:hypothetical protein